MTVLKQLNAALRAAAAAHDDREVFYRHLIEPNARGADAIREALWETLHERLSPR